MKLFSALVVLFFLFWATPVRADYTSAYNDYSFNYSKYRSAYNDYLVAKSSYSTYKTLTAQADAVTRLRLVIQTRDKLFSSYYDLLQEKLLATPGISAEDKNTFFQMKESEKLWMSDHQKKIDAASSLEDLNDASKDFESHYPQMDAETKRAVGMVLLAKTSLLFSHWDQTADTLSLKLKEISIAGENTGLGERGVLSAKNKRGLGQKKADEARTIFSKEKVDLFSAQQKLSEGMQYLREGTNYLTEVIRGITG